MIDQLRTSGRPDMKWILPSMILVMLNVPSHAAPAIDATNPAADRDASLSPMRSIIEHDTIDREALERKYGGVASDIGRERMARFYDQELATLKSFDFEQLDQAGRVDYLLLRTKLEYDRKQLAYRRRQ